MSFELTNILGLPFLSQYQQQVNQALIDSIPSTDKIFHDAIIRYIKAPAKRLRPSLILAINAKTDKKLTDSVLAACVAVELIHLASLIHDDIIDESTSRRGVDTINALEGSNWAIISGDYLFGKAYQIASTISSKAGQSIGGALVELCLGQAEELKDLNNLGRTSRSYYQACRGKTASLLSATCCLGGLVRNLPDESIRALTNFGENFGLAFQLIDDLLDLLSTSKLIGKAPGTDILEGVYTLPVILSLKTDQAKNLQTLIKNSGPHHKIVQLLFATGSINATIKKIKALNYSAENSLMTLDNQIKQRLIKLPEAYFKWAMAELIDPKYKRSLQVN